MSSVQIDQTSYEMPPRDSYRQQRCWHFGQETLHGQQMIIAAPTARVASDVLGRF
jgi:hypothetical protein